MVFCSQVLLVELGHMASLDRMASCFLVLQASTDHKALLDCMVCGWLVPQARLDCKGILGRLEQEGSQDRLALLDQSHLVSCLKDL